ncbi:unnamed protein product [Rotaria magnacalcarata]|uniref:Dynein axonemal intermediate chain 4 n=4 Tax=Rotaria magnacalcarata TaxID=392030 RepID=A0A814FTQ6_9BILA|nr:unnamed protein product [Rotaria magnacalcarata]CAF1660121.1 unnamed protein product [Rotaria magnacalcarata]CAF2138416.1 unnamed protein product [Rotaria magnacalcarata]
MTSTLRSAASVRTGVSGGGRSAGQVSGAARKTAPVVATRSVRTLPKLIENNQDVTPKRLIDPELFYNKVKDSFLTQDASSTPSEAAYSSAQPQVFSATKSMIGLSHGGALNSHGTDAESFPSEQETDQLAQSITMHGTEREHSLIPLEDEIIQPLLTLTETDTIFILSLDSSIVANDSKDLELIKQENERYVELCKSKQGSDVFSDRGMNTFNSSVKNKEVQCERLISQSRDAYASTADMYDSERGQSNIMLVKSAQEVQTIDDGLIRVDQTRSSSSGVEKSHGTRLSDQSIDETMRKPSATKSTSDETKVPEPFDSSKIASCVFIMERVLNLNTNQTKQAIYRGLTPLAGKEAKEVNFTGLALDKLFAYSAEITSNKNVSALGWNRKNPDILAAGYGPFEYNDQHDGLVCCWCLKNQEFPERFFHTPAGVTAVAFSVKFPSLLAVGLFDGTVNVYDVQTNGDKPLLDTEESLGKHTAPVWHLYWVEVEKGRDDDTGEVLMSISTDGRVTQWLLRKGFESNDYMKLKRILSKQTVQKRENGKDTKGSKSENLLFRTSGGLCFDVCPDDKTIYLCGTEEGLIHRCSVSYNEQYLDTYSGHTGPVYRIAWCPLAKGVFLSSSADWTVSLWTVDRFQPCITFASRKKPVFDICWSPKSATIFCCANEEAVEVWDLSKNTLEPINVILATQQYIFTSITYAPNSECVLAGTSNGSVMVYHIENLPAPTSESELLDIIEQQTNNVPPLEDSSSSVASHAAAKEPVVANK